MVELYEYTSRPRYWVVRDEEGYWLVPARDGGWDERVPFVGRVTELGHVTDCGNIDLGIPDERS